MLSFITDIPVYIAYILFSFVITLTVGKLLGVDKRIWLKDAVILAIIFIVLGVIIDAITYLTY